MGRGKNCEKSGLSCQHRDHLVTFGLGASGKWFPKGPGAGGPALGGGAEERGSLGGQGTAAAMAAVGAGPGGAEAPGRALLLCVFLGERGECRRMPSGDPSVRGLFRDRIGSRRPAISRRATARGPGG